MMLVLEVFRVAIWTKLADAFDVYGSHSASIATTSAASNISLWHTDVSHPVHAAVAQ